MKLLKGLAFMGIVLLALLAIGRLFVSQLSSGHSPAGPPGVILAAPSGTHLEELGQVSRVAATTRLAELLGPAADAMNQGVHFFAADGQEVYWYTEKDDSGTPFLVERRSGPGSTRLETRWTGSIKTRVDWALRHDTFDAPQLPAGEERNLYH
jgi:hypothetical protein